MYPTVLPKRGRVERSVRWFGLDPRQLLGDHHWETLYPLSESCGLSHATDICRHIRAFQRESPENGTRHLSKWRSKEEVTILRVCKYTQLKGVEGETDEGLNNKEENAGRKEQWWVMTRGDVSTTCTLDGDPTYLCKRSTSRTEFLIY